MIRKAAFPVKSICPENRFHVFTVFGGWEGKRDVQIPTVITGSETEQTEKRRKRRKTVKDVLMGNMPHVSAIVWTGC